MIAIPFPSNEKERLHDLHAFGILDTPPETDFDQLVELASLICQCKMSLVTLIDGDRQWFKAKKNISDHQTPRSESICSYTIMQNDVFVVENTLTDKRFHNLPVVKNELKVRFYAGIPIFSSNGFALGTVCVLHEEPHQLNDLQKHALRSLARQASILFELRKKNRELKQLADEQARLKTIAEVAARSQKQFLSTMSHEIRTPLNAILGMTNILLAESPTKQQEEYLNSLKFSSENLVAVVNDVLDFNKITSYDLVFEKIDFHLHGLLKDITKSHSVAAGSKKVDLELTIRDSVPPMVNGDSTRLVQVLNNLLGNAIKFTDKGFVKIEVAGEGTTAGETAVRFTVTDSGIGIAKDEIGNIFEEFSQANASITRNFGGTGLGLAICKNLLDLQGSTLQVSSVPGEGSCFYFTLSFNKATTKQQDKPVRNADVSVLKGWHVLVVEDNTLNWVVLKKYLSAWGVTCEQAENGAIAIEMIAANNYDMVFMDLQMPVMDGITAIRILRNEKGFTKPVIAISANLNPKEEFDVEASGFSGSVLKPFHKKELAATMIRFTKKPAAANIH
jgi:two-component system, sensor histidine kinase